MAPPSMSPSCHLSTDIDAYAVINTFNDSVDVPKAEGCLEKCLSESTASARNLLYLPAKFDILHALDCLQTG